MRNYIYLIALLTLSRLIMADQTIAFERLGSGAVMLAKNAKPVKPLMSQMVIYQEEEQGVEKPFLTRIIVNSQFLRIDEGSNNGSFVLYDRSDKTVYSVVHENQTIMVITRKVILGDVPKEIKFGTIRKADTKTPQIGGNDVVQLTQSVNNKACHNYMVVPNVLPGLVNAYQEYRSVLAGQHWVNLSKTPKEMRDPCFTVYNIYKHSAHLKYGLVVSAWNEKKRRQLVDYKKDVPVESVLFVLPKSYKRYQTLSN